MISFGSRKGMGMAAVVGIIAVIVILAGVGLYAANRQTPNPVPDSGSNPDSAMPVPSPDGAGAGEPVVTEQKVYTVEMTPSGFSPTTLEIMKGDKVEFVNKDTKPRWPASGMHPTHLLCPGFDSLKGIAPGETYSFVFNEAKECPMHDHIDSSLRGKIIVKETTTVQ